MPKYIDSTDSDDKWLIVGTLTDAIGTLEASMHCGFDPCIDDALGDFRFVRDRLTELFSKHIT